MKIRKARLDEFKSILEIYEYARAFMKRTGNPNQWRNDNPKEELLLDHINNGNLYVIEENGMLFASFALILGDDPSYMKINGAWLNDEDYAALHSVASNGKASGMFKMMLCYAEDRINNIRIDTHEDNKVMQHLILKNGFSYCGIIHLLNGEERLAYQKICNKE